MPYIQRFDEIGRDDVAAAGGKGANLGELTRAGFPVPPGFVVTTAAYDAFVQANGLAAVIAELASVPADADPAAFETAATKIQVLFTGGAVPVEVAEAIRAAYEPIDGDAVAVRSSATAEDLAEASFAGQQETYLNVRGAGALAAAVTRCWASLWTARAMAYRARQGIAPDAISLAVVVQEMVEAEAAGVLFTANPANGRREEIVISAAWGLGEAVVSGAVTTDDLVVAKTDGHLLSRTTADKQVRTVYTAEGTAEGPVPEAQRRAPVLDDAGAAELAALGRRIEQHYRAPQDIEWARAGGTFWIVQSRPITALPEPIGDVPTEWPLPDPKALYFRASIVEQLPDPLTPLFADLIDQAVTRSLHAMSAELGGRDIFRPDDIGLPTVNGYAFYAYTRGAMGRMMLMARSAASRNLALFGARGWRERFHPRYQRVVDAWDTRAVRDVQASELVAGVEELLDAAAAYYTSVQTIIPVAATSEIAFVRLYDKVVRRDGDPPAQTFLLGFDSAPIRADKALHDLAGWIRQRPDLARWLTTTPTGQILQLLDSDEVPHGVDEGDWQQWRSRFRAHVDRHGRTVYNLDFANPVPADDPAPLLGTLQFYLRGEGQDPHERQRQAVVRREESTKAVRARLDPVRRRAFDELLGWAQRNGPVREDALADLGLAWAPMRRMLHELGRRLAAAGAVERPADVFWLRRDELDRLVADLDAGRDHLPSHAEAVARRRTVWRGQRQATPPQMLPERSWIRMFDRFMPAVVDQQAGDTLTGVGASAGTVTGPARVLAGPQDFARMQPGDVLVAAITTPAWTPLFALASAVVTDIGGPLSHSSIVAREYGIPAVLATGVATRRIADGQIVRVDGDAGTVTLLDAAEGAPADDAPAPGAPAGPRQPRRSRAAIGAGVVAATAVGVFAARRRTRQ